MPRQMPFFLRVVKTGGWLIGAFATVLIGGFLVLAGSDFGPYTVNGAAASKEEFMAFAVPVLGGYLVLSLMLVATSWGLHRHSPWSRSSLFALGIGFAAYAIAVGYVAGLPLRQVATALATSALMIASLWWYLYRDDAVVSYYDSVAARPEGGLDPPS